MANETTVTTGKVRFSYVTLFEPKAGPDGGDPKYSVVLLIPKTDTTTYQKIKAAEAAARSNFCAKKGPQALPSNPLSPLHDGDGDKPNGGSYGPECAGHWVLNVSSKQRPIIVGTERNAGGKLLPITEPTEIYSGCYGRAQINFYGYNNRRKGIGAGLLSVQKLADGEPLGGSYGSADAFDDGFADDSVDDIF